MIGRDLEIYSESSPPTSYTPSTPSTPAKSTILSFQPAGLESQASTPVATALLTPSTFESKSNLFERFLKLKTAFDNAMAQERAATCAASESQNMPTHVTRLATIKQIETYMDMIF